MRFNGGNFLPMATERSELRELIDLVNKFIDYAEQLKSKGKITEQQYIAMTKSKIEFLENIAEEKQEYIIEKQEKNLFY